MQFSAAKVAISFYVLAWQAGRLVGWRLPRLISAPSTLPRQATESYRKLQKAKERPIDVSVLRSLRDGLKARTQRGPKGPKGEWKGPSRPLSLRLRLNGHVGVAGHFHHGANPFPEKGAHRAYVVSP
jgi:hypothetical protein